MKSLNIYIYILLSVFLVTSQIGCRKSYDPGDWDLIPERHEPDEPEDNDPREVKTIKVMSFNMQIGAGDANMPLVKKLVKEYDPDLLFLRQVDSATNRADKVNRPQIVADEVGMESFFVKNFDYQTGGFGNAVLSKFPILEKEGVILNRVEGSTAELRSLAKIKVEIDEHNSLYFMGTELDPNVDNRNLQTREILDLSRELKDPVVLVGNFNEQEGKGQVIDFLRGFFTFACLGSGCPLNAPKAEPTGVYDYVTYYAEDDSQISIGNYGPLTESPNTFLPMTAEIKFKLNEE